MRQVSYLAIIAAALAVSGMSPAVAKDYKIGVSNTVQGNGWREEMICAIKAQAIASGKVSKLNIAHRNTDAAGQLVTQADGIPIHTGGGGMVVEALLKAFAAEIAPGEVFISSDPYEAGGNHLQVRTRSGYFAGAEQAKNNAQPPAPAPNGPKR